MDGAGVNIPLLVIQVLIWGQPLALLALLVQGTLLIWGFPHVLLTHLVEGEIYYYCLYFKVNHGLVINVQDETKLGPQLLKLLASFLYMPCLSLDHAHV